MPRVLTELTSVTNLKYKDANGNGFSRFVAVGGVKGLQIQITPSNTKSWSLRYTLYTQA